MFDAFRDFSTDRYSVVSGIFSDFATMTCTGIACGPAAPAPPAAVLPHPVAHTAPATASVSANALASVSCKRERPRPVKGKSPYSTLQILRHHGVRTNP